MGDLQLCIDANKQAGHRTRTRNRNIKWHGAPGCVVILGLGTIRLCLNQETPRYRLAISQTYTGNVDSLALPNTVRKEPNILRVLARGLSSLDEKVLTRVRLWHR